MAQIKPPIVPDSLYRFRSFSHSPQAVEREIDAILNNYLYCSHFTRMNDPMEGFYVPSGSLRGEADYRGTIKEITQAKADIGIACLTETHENVLMWAHYAGNYTGMCIEYSSLALTQGLPDSVSLVRLAYVEEPPTLAVGEVNNAGTTVVRILSQKRHNWSYEREWRVLGPIGPVRIGLKTAVQALYFGSRIDLRIRQKILSKIQGKKIRAYMMEVDGYGHSWTPINDFARRSQTQRAAANSTRPARVVAKRKPRRALSSRN